MDTKATLLMIAVALPAAGCLTLDIENEPPVARAQIVVNGTAYASGQEIEYAGTPLAVTLDGSQSTDEDGAIERYVWLRTDATAEERMMNAAGDPAPAMTTQVTLEEGEFQYSLWVVDNEGKTSTPSTVTVNLVMPSMYMPDAMCSAEYTHPNGETCSECVCSPTELTGCLPDYQRCFENADPEFTTVCKALVACALATNCSASGTCYMATTCMPEVDAAANLGGGNIGLCGMPEMADTNACAAATLLGACTTMNCGTACALD